MKHYLIAAVISIALCACQQAQQTEGDAAAQSETQSTDSQGVTANDAGTTAMQQVVDPVQTVSSEKFSIDPARLDACSPAVEATARWNVSDQAGLTKVELRTASGKLFAAGGKAGEARTGKWARPGTKLVLIDPANGATLAETVIGGPVCN